MCSSGGGSTSAPKTEPEKEPVKEPVQADAAAAKTMGGTRNKTAGLAGRDTKTGARGLNADTVATKKKELLGG